MSLRSTLKAVIAGETLSSDQMERAFEVIMSGLADPLVAAGLLCALAARGESVEEVTGAARTMRRMAEPFPSARASAGIDTCGTGGDGAGTFNISTAAAFVVAAAGVPVAKHGNRAVSSKSGSADLLVALGANIDLGPEPMARVLDSCNIGFLFAPVYHKAMRHAMPIRRTLGVRTIFNLLGPISNPAGVKRQVIGVFAPRWLSLADVLARLGGERAMVVHGEPGLDELSLVGATRVAELRDDGSVSHYTLHPEPLGLATCRVEELVGGDAADNARTLQLIFAPGQKELGPIARAVQLNAGASLYVASEASSVAEGVSLAGELIRSGAALGALERFINETRSALS